MVHAEDFMFWAWGVGKGQVSETRFTLLPGDIKLENFWTHRHSSCILTQPLPPPPNGMLPDQPPGVNPFQGQPNGEIGVIL